MRKLFAVLLSLSAFFSTANSFAEPRQEHYALCRTNDDKKLFVFFHEVGETKLLVEVFHAQDRQGNSWKYAGDILGTVKKPNDVITDSWNLVSIPYRNEEMTVRFSHDEYHYNGVPSGGFVIERTYNDWIENGKCFFSDKKPVMGRSVLKILDAMMPTDYGTHKTQYGERCSGQLFRFEEGATLQLFHYNPWSKLRDWANVEIDLEEPWIRWNDLYVTLANGGVYEPVLDFAGKESGTYDSVDLFYGQRSHAGGCGGMKSERPPSLPRDSRVECDFVHPNRTLVIPADHLTLTVFEHGDTGNRRVETTPVYYHWEMDPVTNQPKYDAHWGYKLQNSPEYDLLNIFFQGQDRTQAPAVVRAPDTRHSGECRIFQSED